MSTISFSAQLVNLDRKTLEKLFEKDDYQRRDEIQRTKKELEKLELRYKNLRNAFLDKQVTPFDYQEMKSMIDKDIVIQRINSLIYNKKYHHSGYIFRRKFKCWRTSWSITGRQTVEQRRRFLVPSLPKN